MMFLHMVPCYGIYGKVRRFAYSELGLLAGDKCNAEKRMDALKFRQRFHYVLSREIHLSEAL